MACSPGYHRGTRAPTARHVESSDGIWEASSSNPGEQADFSLRQNVIRISEDFLEYNHAKKLHAWSKSCKHLVVGLKVRTCCWPKRRRVDVWLTTDAEFRSSQVTKLASLATPSCCCCISQRCLMGCFKLITLFLDESMPWSTFFALTCLTDLLFTSKCFKRPKTLDHLWIYSRSEGNKSSWCIGGYDQVFFQMHHRLVHHVF